MALSFEKKKKKKTYLKTKNALKNCTWVFTMLASVGSCYGKIFVILANEQSLRNCQSLLKL